MTFTSQQITLHNLVPPVNYLLINAIAIGTRLDTPVVQMMNTETTTGEDKMSTTKIKFAATLIAVALLITGIFVFSVQRREPAATTEQSLPEPVSVTPASADPNEMGFGPDTNPLPDQRPFADDYSGFELPAGVGVTQEDLDLLDSLPFEDVRDVHLDEDRALLATAGGVIEFFLADSSFAIYSYPHGLLTYDCYAICPYGDNILVGASDGVYLINAIGVIEPVWVEINDTVTTIKCFNGCYYVGTRHDGLYEINGELVANILPDKSIVDVSDNMFALWVSTEQDGLLYYDDKGWHQRYLANNPNAFVEVTALESAFDKLFVGTPRGLFVFNGDSWKHYDSLDYLFEPRITALAAGKSYVYIGTESEGVFAYYDGWISSLDWSDDLFVSSIDIHDGRYLVGLSKGGAILADQRGALDLLPLIKNATVIFSAR